MEFSREWSWALRGPLPGRLRNCIVAWVALCALGLWPLLGARAATQSKATAAAPQSIVVVGDSLSAEYGLPRGTGWVALLDRKLVAEKRPVSVVNASISGDTTAGGRSRLPAVLQQYHPSVVVIELGGNDALRGLSLASTRANLQAMVQASQKAGAKVLLLGIQVPPNYGADYSTRFAAVFTQVSQSQHVPLVPFLLKGIADRPDAMALFQADRIHPTAQAHPQILANVWPALRALLH